MHFLLALAATCLFAVAFDWMIFFHLQTYRNSSFRSGPNRPYKFGPPSKLLLGVAWVMPAAYAISKGMSEPNVYWAAFCAAFVPYVGLASYLAIRD